VTQPFVIVGATRTPMGSFQGEFASLMAPQLGAHAIRAPVERSGLKPEAVEEVIMGGVRSAGLADQYVLAPPLQPG
jgi:acetyl-CoA C-acetyltransferase